jgi:hypothetical protein
MCVAALRRGARVAGQRAGAQPALARRLLLRAVLPVPGGGLLKPLYKASTKLFYLLTL